jgi:hypothetical protein
VCALSVENAERIGGVAFLGVPAFEAFTSVLDNYARVELLVRLHDHLPAFLIDPVTSFVCMCFGLWLLHLSHNRQLKRVSASGGLLDSTGSEYRREEKLKWLVPVLVVFLIALVLVSMLAVGYSLKYKGSPPRVPAAPYPPLFALNKTPTSQRGLKTTPPILASAPNGIVNAAPNQGSETVNNNFISPPSTGNLKTRCENLATAIEDFYRNKIEERKGLFASSTSVGDVNGEQLKSKLNLWQGNLSFVFRTQILPAVVDIQQECATLHIRNADLDGEIKQVQDFINESGGRWVNSVNIYDVEKIAQELDALANQIPQ